MTAITLKNIPDILHELLKKRAEIHHRSLNSEIIVCLEGVVKSSSIEINPFLKHLREIRKGISPKLTDKRLATLKKGGRS